MKVTAAAQQEDEHALLAFHVDCSEGITWAMVPTHPRWTIRADGDQMPAVAVQPAVLPPVPGKVAGVLPGGGGPRAAMHGLCAGQSGGHRRGVARACDGSHCCARVQVRSAA